MSASRDPDTILAAWLDDGPEDLPYSTRRAITTAVRTTPQSRVGPLGPSAWRPPMSMPKAALAAVAVLVLAVSGFMLLGRPAEQPGAVGAPASPSPSPTATATAPRPRPPRPPRRGRTRDHRVDAVHLCGVRGHVERPDGWSKVAAATRKWQVGDESEESGDKIFDEFANVDRSDQDGDGIAMLLYQRPAGSGADIASREGLAAWHQTNVCHDPQACGNVIEPMCVGKTA